MPGILLGLFFGVLLGFGAGVGIERGIGVNKKTDEAIAQCESELPRNKTCEVVITARVKE